jgi:hypothetical protein
MTFFAQSGATIGVILLAMVVVAWIETVIPLHCGERSDRAHIGPNLALTFITFATNLFFNIALVAILMQLTRLGWGVLNALPQPAFVRLAVVVLGLDFSFYVAHVAMHRFPASGATTSCTTVTPSWMSAPRSASIRVRASSATRSWRYSPWRSERDRAPSRRTGHGRLSTVSWSTRTSGFRCGSTA